MLSSQERACARAFDPKRRLMEIGRQCGYSELSYVRFTLSFATRLRKRPGAARVRRCVALSGLRGLELAYCSNVSLTSELSAVKVAPCSVSRAGPTCSAGLLEGVSLAAYAYALVFLLFVGFSKVCVPW